MPAKGKFLCVHLGRTTQTEAAARNEDVGGRDGQPVQADWACACGIYDRRYGNNSRPRPGICRGPSPENCAEFSPDRERPV